MILDVLVGLLECASGQLDTLEVPVCREFINPGNDAPHDVCSSATSQGIVHDGQLWVAHLGTTQGWPAPTGLPSTCTEPWTDLIEVGITRCAAKINDNGDAPPAAAVTQDAINQERDRLLLRNAIMCCMPIDGRSMFVQGWDPIPPQGGCVGGVWTVFVRDDGCNCGNLGFGNGES